jgi:hypothetical protein
MGKWQSSFRFPGMAKSSSGPVYVDIVYIENVHHSTPHPYIYDLKTSLLQRLLLWRISKPCSSISSKLDSLFVSTVPSPYYLVYDNPDSTVYNNHAELPGCCGFSIRKPSLSNPNFHSHVSVNLRLSFLHSFPHPQSGVSPKLCKNAVEFYSIFYMATLHVKRPLFQFPSRAQCRLQVACLHICGYSSVWQYPSKNWGGVFWVQISQPLCTYWAQVGLEGQAVLWSSEDVWSMWNSSWELFLQRLTIPQGRKLCQQGCARRERGHA